MKELVAFAADLIAHHDGLVEPAHDAIVTLLPPALAQALGLDDAVTLSTAPVDGAVSIAYGSRALERLVQLATEHTPLAAARLVHTQPASSAVAERAAEALELRNAVFTVIGIQPIRAERLLLHALVSLEGDDRRQMLVSTTISRRTLTPLPTFASLLAPHHLEPDAAPTSLPEAEARALLAAAELDCWRRAEPFVSNVHALMQQRKARDRDRIRRYFADLTHELDARAPYHKLDPEAIAARRTAFDRDRQAKLDALDPRYTLKADLRAVSILRLQAPAFAIELHLKRRKASRDLIVEYDVHTRALVPPRCEGCGGPAERPAACDDAVHLLCERCVPDAKGRFTCPKCQGK